MRLLFIASASVLVLACSSSPSPSPTPSTGGGAGGGGSGAGSDTTTSDRCVDAGGDCSKGEKCCGTGVCVVDVANPSKGTCADACLDNSQCKSGCCDVLKGGTQAVCSPPSYCAPTCLAAGELCSLGTCCADSVCVTSTVDGTRCRAKCMTHTQCQSGCCAPLNNTGEYVCSTPNFCGR